MPKINTETGSSSRNSWSIGKLAGMTRYFFDFRSSGRSSTDEEGENLSDMGAAHELAVATLAEAIKTAIVEGSSGQQFTIEVRDELGPVLHVTAILESKLFRKQ